MSDHPIVETMTTVSAVGAIASPIWLPYLVGASQVAGLMAPILGVIWLVVQIWDKFKRS